MAEQYELDGVEIEQTANLMKQIKEHVLELKRRKWAVEEAEEALRKAQASYDDYSQHVLPDMFKMNGLDMLQMDDGSIVRVITTTKCGINKNDTDRANVAKWLREHDGGALVKSECVCPSSQLQDLKNAGIIYQEETTMNTNAVKAFILDQLGQKGAPAKITKEDLPKGLNFYQFDEMEVVVK